MTYYLTVAEVLAVHTDQIERYGDSHGVRDPGLLESALYEPQTGYYADLVEEAAAMWETWRRTMPSSMQQAHGFRRRGRGDPTEHTLLAKSHSL
jgi:hypothetical protein